MNKFHVVFIAFPAIGNLIPTVEFARLLANHDPRFIPTMLLIDVPERPIVNSYNQSCVATSAINFIHLPPVDPPSPDEYQTSLGYTCFLVAKHKLHVKNAIAQLMSTESASDSDSTTVRVAGLFVDMFSTTMIDVANELGIPCYLYFSSPVTFLGFLLYFPTLDPMFASEFVDSDSGLMFPKDPAAANTSELIIPGFANPLPYLMLPNRVLHRKQEGYLWFLHHASRYKETKGMIVNTFRELEPYAIDSVSNWNGDWPPIFPIGPVLDLVGPAQWHPERAQHDSIMHWLDHQPPSSVVFLCFGSMGSLSGAQLREIAVGLEQGGFRFLWSIREPPKRELDLPGEYRNVEEIEMLPKGFVDRSRRAGIGLVCGWVTQAVILSHQAIGGFVSHCGWNSILESIWYGVPIATWPLYAEQQMNAFQLVKELQLAVEIRLDYREGSELVSPEELERALRCLMSENDEVRRKVMEMKEKSRAALMPNGSSYKSLAALIQELTAEI